ncbi:protein of unknown function [Candidatus Nitrotoga arctica]|uniref:Uncharacterized protein n=1 Tax=Candidatus Nitrotoga arctica TaxID=453162 RepID=A0ABN8ANS9_9PROT|nr:protein of unknown function [Candidatus Nitrotoga arctica]
MWRLSVSHITKVFDPTILFISANTGDTKKTDNKMNKILFTFLMIFSYASKLN